MWPLARLLTKAAINQQHNPGLGGLQQGLGGLHWVDCFTDTTNNVTWDTLQWVSGMNDAHLGRSPHPSPSTPQHEDEIAWLRRRVKEVLWHP